MKRFFLELSYKGTNYAGFQVQDNAPTIQLEIQKALQLFYRQEILLTGSSRTDSGVHAMQNFFHFDTEINIEEKQVYNLNAILANDIVIKSIVEVSNDLHSRFHATHRLYHYYLCQYKDPFAQETTWHYPYKVELDLLNQAAAILMEYDDFTSFSKRNTQTHTKLCNISISKWEMDAGKLVYKVQSNRFLRGMVRGLVATQLLVGKGKISMPEFRQIIEAKNGAKADFSAPPHGLFLMEVGYPSKMSDV